MDRILNVLSMDSPVCADILLTRKKPGKQNLMIEDLPFPNSLTLWPLKFLLLSEH